MFSCGWLLVLVGAVRADAVEVLEEELTIAFAVVARLVPGVLGAQSREFRRVPVEHQRRALRASRKQRRKSRRRERTRIDEADARRAGVERVVTQARAPARQELVDALHVPARLLAAEGIAQAQPLDVEGKLAVLLAVEVLALELELLAASAAVRRPLQDRIQAPGFGIAGEGIDDRLVEIVHVFVGPILSVQFEP